MQTPDLAGWPPDLKAVFAAVGRAMAGGRLYPHTLKTLPTSRDGVLPGHRVEIVHRSKTQLGRSTGLYVITITGDRWRGSQWSLRSGALEGLSREAALLETSRLPAKQRT